MSKTFWNLVKTTPAMLGASVLVAQTAIAAPVDKTQTQDSKNSFAPSQFLAQALPTTPDNTLRVDPAAQELINRVQKAQQSKYINGNVNTGVSSMSQSQVTSVNQLRDVEPTAWAYEALRSLVERYGCIVGYPDRTYRGDRALSRWEFAAGVNACLNALERLLQDGLAVPREDIDKLNRLAKEFETELAALGARIDNLEQRTAFLEDHQFSTTTKLRGEAIISIADSFGDAAIGTPGNRAGDEDISVAAINTRVRLNLETSFTGKDLLRTRLQAGNFNTTFNRTGVTGTNMTRLAYDDGVDNAVSIDDLWYRAPIGPVTVWVGANALNLDDVFVTANPFLADSGSGALSRLERYNNFVYRGPSGAGLAARFNIGDILNVTGTYLADGATANNPTDNNGLFNGSYSAGAQVGFSFIKAFDLYFTYVHSYQTAARMGSGLFGNVSGLDAENPFNPTGASGQNVATSSDRYGLSASWRVLPNLNLAAWGGYATATAEQSNRTFSAGDYVELWTWNANLSIIDLFKQGAVLSLGGGLPPKGDRVTSSYVIEAQYQFPINKNILLTPGFFVVLDPNNNDRNADQWMGVIRTTFKF
ncbi:MAG: hypothetical protein N5P05_000938 [Chroococcopsis gigantea SAG 12.99]|nr:carbohydrate porin [Chlorogloea purpurea SAG 13.99]MDV2999332.1 hypothetical protein [Chroococcopsis gigantea SAG 12.99]